MALVQVRIDPKIKKAADSLFAALGTNTSAAVRLFINESLIIKNIPFKPTGETDLDSIPGIQKPKDPQPAGIALKNFAEALTKEDAKSLAAFIKEYRNN
ncbi:MAG: type II toxin-antitoxin system RelB/DinJ family antitoxin [Holophagaceae bacterium]|nr:type II toxin-antitoxin system RelB/DinJ family antitoxin [Holophagaceae bacterium]